MRTAAAMTARYPAGRTGKLGLAAHRFGFFLGAGSSQLGFVPP
jgi:hypothetical protein